MLRPSGGEKCRLAVFLASEASSWITGALIPMGGGNLAMNAGGSVGTEVFKKAAPKKP